MARRLEWLGNERLRLVVLLGVLALLGLYATSSWTGLFGRGGPSSAFAGADGCPSEGAPSVDSADRAELRALRRQLRGLVAFAPGTVPYEEGVVGAEVAWSDGEPEIGALPPGRSDIPHGFEMRWWLPNRDDLVADAWVFSGEQEAEDFIARASSSSCRLASSAYKALLLPEAVNLGWRNPDGYQQEDAFVGRGRTVYRVGVVKAGAGADIDGLARENALRMVDRISCALPKAGCERSLEKIAAGFGEGPRPS